MAIDLSPFIDNTARLPSIPKVVGKIVDLARCGDVDIPNLASLISSDPALAAKTLQFANSPMYGSEHKIENLRRAVVLLGLDTTVNLALSFSLSSSLKEQTQSGLHYPLFWRRSFLAAAAAKKLGQIIGERGLEELFIAGLLQDIGMIAIDRIKPDFYTELRSDQVFHQRVREYEIERLGGDHAESGAWLCKHWELADRTTQAIANSHRPGRLSQTVGDQFIRCVCVSGVAADYIILGESADARKQLYLQAQRILSLSADKVDGLIVYLRDKIPEMEALFDVKLTESSSQSELLEKANETLAELNLQKLTRNRNKDGESNKVDNESRFDPESGAFSREFIKHYLPDAFALANRSGRVLSLIFVDIRNMAMIHKRLGKDVVSYLTEVSKLLKGMLRAGDMVFRYSDNQFLILLHDAMPVDANTVSQRLSKAVVEFEVHHKKGTIIADVACGVATHDHSSALTTSDEWLNEAYSNLADN
ncbi:Uncharacterised protein [Zhongshania aliphaticivorans]|uniref:Uncharacterized protein n=1 Tax=Zhongshania aliphaticivorans TaxID=1470434 RepID=A0A5S9NWW8_9GAMM|nr:HDOD domain-containing protein [Zhongshania aliphaticivorans]CAA0088839.1 Uncharacterised protein [Zhongshania aliphaticivorans]CAA0095248.1 Uncharacterised protein [Zhongshania aliphaticivorans]